MTEPVAARSGAGGDRRSRGVGRRRYRSEVSTVHRVAIGSVAVLAAVAAATQPAAPTGSAVLDVVYRMAFAVAVTLVAAPARRWALVIASALVAAGALGFSLAVAVAALLLSVVLIVRDLRDRVWGAVVGALVAVASMGLQVGGFLGSATVVTVAAVGCLVASGIRNSSAMTRVRLTRGARVVGAVVAVALASALVLALRAQSWVSSGVTQTNKAISLLRDGRSAEASESFRRAAESFRHAATDADAWWSFPARAVPGVGQNIAVVRVVADSGARLTAAAQRTSAEVDYELIRRPGGGIDLNRLGQFAEPVDEAARELASATVAVDSLDSPWIIEPLADRLDLFRRKVDELDADAQLAKVAVERAPEMLGGSGPRRYLVLLGNPAESRDLGGHIGNWAELVADQGLLELVKVGRPAELSRPAGEAELADSGLPESLLSLLPATYPQNWGGSIDFPTDARLAARLYESVTGSPVDGVVYADPSVLAAMLRITGPVPVPGLGRQIDADDAVRFLTYDQFVEFTDNDQGDSAVTTLVRDVFDRFVAARLPGPDRLGAVFGPLVRDDRLRMYSVHEEDEPLLARVGLDVRLPLDDDDVDLLAVVSRNANPSKIDSFLHRDTAVDVRWNPDDGEVLTTVRVTLRNDAPASGLPAVVIGNGNGAPDGTNTMDLAVLTPSEELQAVVVDGRADVPASTVAEGDVFRHETRIAIPPGGTSVVEFVFADSREPSDRYELFFAGQPTANPGSAQIVVRTAGHRPLPGKGIVVVGDTVTTTQSAAQNTQISLRVK